MDVIKHEEHIIVSGDLNEHIGTQRKNLENVIGEHSIGERK